MVMIGREPTIAVTNSFVLLDISVSNSNNWQLWIEDWIRNVLLEYVIANNFSFISFFSVSSVLKLETSLMAVIHKKSKWC